MKKILVFSAVIGLGILFLSACSKLDSESATITPAPVFNVSEQAENPETQQIELEDGNYIVSTEDSQVAWSGKRILGSGHSGLVNLKSANFIVENKILIAGEFIIDMTSIHNSEGNEALVKHLKSTDFFDVERYNEAKLVITGSELNQLASFLIKADLTIKDISVPVEFQANFEAKEGSLAILSDLIIDRTLWNIRYDSGSFYEDLGDAAIEDEIGFKIYLVAMKE